MSDGVLDPLDEWERGDTTLLDIVDHVLNQGVVLKGDLVLGVAGVDLVYAQVSLLLCAADRILPRPEAVDPPEALPRSASPSPPKAVSATPPAGGDEAP